MTEQTGGAQNAPQYRKRSRSAKPLLWVIAGIAVAVIVALVLFFTLRGGDNRAEGGDGTRTLTVGLTLQPTNLDIRKTGGVALDQILIDNVYQGLVGLRSGSLDEFVPVLAKDLPEISDDGRTYTFTLRDGVAFHSGNALTAKDVVDSLNAEGSNFTLKHAIGPDTVATSPDEHTIVISLATPNSELMWQLANRPGLVFESAYTDDLASTTNGTGPYELQDWRQGDSITFVSNTAYWGTAPTLDQVVWRYIPDANAAVNAALGDDLDVLTPVTSSLVGQFDGDDRFTLQRSASTDVFTLAYNSAKAPLNDLRVRQALSQAIDSQAIIDAFYGDGKPLGGPITDIEPAYEDLTRINSYDPAHAKQLLAEAGVSNLTLTLTVPNHYPNDPINVLVTQFAEIGVTLKVDSVEFPTWLSTVYTAPADGSPRGYDLSYVDHVEPNDFVNYVTPGYYFDLVNPEALKLYDQAIEATDAATAIDLRKQAARIVAADAPAKWLINYTPSSAIGTHVSGFPKSNTNSRINLDGITVK